MSDAQIEHLCRGNERQRKDANGPANHHLSAGPDRTAHMATPDHQHLDPKTRKQYKPKQMHNRSSPVISKPSFDYVLCLEILKWAGQEEW